MCKKLGSLLLVLVFAVSMLTAVPVLGAEYTSITLEQTVTGLAINGTGQAVVHGVDATGAKTAITEGVTYSVTKTGTRDVVTVDSATGAIKAVSEGTAILTATYGELTASAFIIVGVEHSALGYDTAEATAFTISYPQAGSMKFGVDENDVPSKAGDILLTAKDANGVAYLNRYLFTDTTELDTTVKRAGEGSLHLEQINLSEKTVVGTDTPLAAYEKNTLLNGRWARTSMITLADTAAKRGVAEFWFYDDSESTSSFWIISGGSFPRADGSSGTTQALRGRFSIGTGGYSYAKDGAAQPEPQILKTLPRSKGWHQFILDYSSPNAYVMYIDGQVMFSLTETGRNVGLPAIQNDRTLSGNNAKHELWLDTAVIYDTTLTVPLAPVISELSIKGKALEEQELSADVTAHDDNGDAITGYEYVWEKSANGTDGWTSVGTAATYTVSANDIGSYLRVGVVAKTGAAEQANSEMVYSDAFGPVEAKPDTDQQNFTALDITKTASFFKTIGQTAKIAVTGISENGVYDLTEYEKVTYSTDDPYTASVSADGTITAVDDGYTILTVSVTNADGSKAEATMILTVATTAHFVDFETLETNAAGTIMKTDEYARTGSYALATKANADVYSAYTTSNSLAEGWFYDNGKRDASAGRNLFFQGSNNRYVKIDGVWRLPTGTEWQNTDAANKKEFLLGGLNVGILSGTNEYYGVRHSPSGHRPNVGPGMEILLDSDKAGTGYIGEPEKSGTFYTDGESLPLVERTEGWHQVSIVVDMGKEGAENVATDKGSTKVYIDGILVFEEKYVYNGFGCVRGTGAAGSEFAIYDDFLHANIKNNARPALVTDMELSGTAMVEKTMTVSETVTDKNGDAPAASTYQWEVSSDGATGWTAVTGANTASYTFVEADQGKYFRVAVTPHSTVAPVDGNAAYSAVIGPVSALKTEPWVEEGSYSVSGDGLVGHILTANYTYASDEETGDEQGETEIVWERAAQEAGPYTVISNASGKTYAPGVADAGKYVRATITPVDVNGLRGTSVTTAAIKIDGTVEYFVAVDGNDENAGSESAPFATIAKARDVIRASLASGDVTADSIVVNIKGGEYVLNSNLQFTAEDSGTEECPIIYQAYNGEDVVLTTAKKLDGSKIQKVTDAKLLDRLNEDYAKDKLYMLDLGAQGVEAPALKANGSSGAQRFYLNGVELVNARWPNDDKSGEQYFTRAQPAPDGTFDATQYNGAGQKQAMQYVDEENRSANWSIKSGDAFFGGAIAYLWARTTLTIDTLDPETKIVKSSTTSSYGQSTYTAKTERYLYFENLFEEIDMPGESYVDREKNILYFYPVGDMTKPEITLGGAVANLINVTGASHITFKGLDVKQNGGTAYNLSTTCDSVTIEDAVVSNISGVGIVAAGSNITVQGCDVYDISGNAIQVRGGDRATLTSSGNVITNNKVHGANGSTDAIHISGVGHVISHNEIFDYDMGALRFADTNNLLIEYNEIYDVQLLNADGGALYWGRNPTELGNVVRYNYFYDIGGHIGAHGQQSIFTDDGETGPYIYGNIFYHGGLPQFPLKTNGGVFHYVANNIIIDNAVGFYFQDWGRGSTGVTNGLIYSRWWTYIQDLADLYGSSNTNLFNDNRKNLLFSEEWKDYYTNVEETGWWAQVFKHFNWDMYNAANEFKTDKDKAGLTQWMEENLPAEHTNIMKENVLINVPTVANGWRKLENNLSLDMETGMGLFEDYGTDFDLTAAGLAKIRESIPGFEDLDFDAMGLEFEVGGSAPGASDLYITGVPAKGSQLVANYTYSDADGDAEGKSKIFWYASETADGEYARIAEGYGKYYTVGDDYEGKYLRFEVVPYDVTMNYDDAHVSAPIFVEATSDVDKLALWEAITKANNLLENAVAGTEDGQYPQSAIDTLKKLVDEALVVANNTAAFQYQVDAVLEKLTAGIGVFEGSMISSAEFMSIAGMLADEEGWQQSVGEAATLENGVLTLPSNNTIAYTAKKFDNQIFVFKMKIEKTGENPKLGNSVAFRAQNASSVTYGSATYLWWMKNDLNEAQFFDRSGHNAVPIDEFTNNLIELDKEYTIAIGAYDTAGEAVKFVLYIDDLTTPVFERTYSKSEDNGVLYGKDGYFMLGANGSDVTAKIYAVDAADVTELEKAAADAKELLDTMVAGDGYGQYPASFVESLENAVAKAEEMIENENAVQEIVDETAASLNNLVNSAKANANTKMDVTGNGEATIDYDLPEAEFNVTDSSVTAFTLKMDPTKKQPAYLFTYEGADGTVTTEIAKGAVLSANGWDGTFDLPILGTTPSEELAGDNFTVLSMGEPGKVIGSSEIVRIVLPGQAGKALSYLQDNGSYKTISKNKNLAADSFEAAKAELPNGGVAKVNVGEDMVIYTTYLTEFVAYDWKAATTTPTVTPTTPAIVVPNQPIGGGTSGSGIVGNTGNNQSTDKPAKSRFTDIIGHWAENDINKMADAGIVSGVTATTFEPDRSITRAEFAALITRALKLTAANDDSVFTDVASDAWYAKEVAAAAGAGLIVGYNGAFRPDDNITREEMAVVIMKAYNFLGKSPLTGQIDKFADKGEISEWAYSYVDQAVSVGLISGMTADTFAPADNATRAQVTSVIKRLLDL